MKSTRTRLLLGFGLVMAVGLCAFGALVYLLVAQNLSTDIDRLVQDKAIIISQALPRENPAVNPTLPPWTELYLDTGRYSLFVQVFDRDGRLLSRSANMNEDLPISDRTRQQTEGKLGVVLETVKSPKGEDLRIATYPLWFWREGRNQVTGFAQAAVPLAARDEILRRLLLWLAVGIPSLLVVALVLCRGLINQWLRSVSAATETARQISVQNLSRQRLFIPSEDAELAGLARTFNELLDRLEAAYTTQQRFVADASHELRTPLTVLRGEIEVALRRERGGQEYRDVLVSNKEEIERMSRLVENLLALAHADAGEAIAAREQVDVSELCAEVCRKLGPLAEARKVSLQCAPAEAAVVRGDRYPLERVFFNLAENAIRYTPAGENVNLSVSVSESEVAVIVADTGPGIPAEHLPNIFERFYRVDKARSRELGGAGLGLAIVRAFVQAHGGRIEVLSQLGHGSTFTVWLPKFDPAA